MSSKSQVKLLYLSKEYELEIQELSVLEEKYSKMVKRESENRRNNPTTERK